MKSMYLFFSKITLEKKVLLITLTPILTILLNVRTMLLGLVILIIIDLLTGIRKSLFLKNLSFNIFKKHFWQTLKSKGMRDTWRKSYEYGIGILVFAIFEGSILKLNSISIGSSMFTLTELAIIAATLVEIWSIFENMEAVSGRNLLKRLSFLLPQSIQKLLGKKKEETNE